MWIVCLADDSHEMPSLILSGNKIYFKVLSAVVVSPFRVNNDFVIFYPPHPIPCKTKF